MKSSRASKPRRVKLRLRPQGQQKPMVEVRDLMLPGSPEYDGGLPGVTFRWLTPCKRRWWFYPCKSVEEFASDLRFKNMEFCT